MTISYKRLWKLLIDRDMKKKELRELTGLSVASMAKLAKNQNVNTNVLLRICEALHCDLQDIAEVVEDANKIDFEVKVMPPQSKGENNV